MADTKETLATHRAEEQRSAARWEAEKQYLVQRVDLYKRLLEAKEEHHGDGAVLRDRYTQLEELLAETREQSASKIREQEKELKELNDQIQILTLKSGTIMMCKTLCVCVCVH